MHILIILCNGGTVLMCKNIVKILIISLLAVLSVRPEYDTAGMTKQLNKINDIVGDVIQKTEYGKVVDPLLVANRVQEKSSELGLNLDFEVRHNDYATDFNVSGTCNVTGVDICDISVKKDAIGEHYISTKLDPDNDGCVTNCEDGRLCVAEPLESVFVMNGREMRPGSGHDFEVGGSNVYKVRNLPSLHQKVNGPCGYYALFNLLKIYHGETSPAQLLDRAAFESLYPLWWAHCSCADAISNYDLQSLIKNKVTSLCKENVIISCCDVNYKNKFDEMEVLKFGDDNSLAARVQDFRVNGRAQYLIVGTDKEKQDISGIKLKWDNFNNRRSCTPGHWIAMKIEWASKPGYSPVIITVSDSSGAYDNRFAETIHWYYYMFVQKDANYSTLDYSCLDDYCAAEVACQDSQKVVKPEEQAIAGYYCGENAASNYTSDYDYNNYDNYNYEDYSEYDTSAYNNYEKKEDNSASFARSKDEDLTYVLKDQPDRNYWVW